MIQRPSEGEHNPYYSKYIALVTETDVLAVLERQPEEVRSFAASLQPERETYSYAPGKWSVRQVIGHLTDTERVFGYRAFRISRGDETPLSGFDENVYVQRSPYGNVPAAQLAEEFALVRAANLALLRQLDEPHWPLKGTANNSPISVRALAYIMAGHVRHHQQGLRSNYGIA
jgi:DinB family protein